MSSTKKSPLDIRACRSCGALVVWTETSKGRRMPVDAEPAENGNLRLVEREGEVPLAVNDTEETTALFATGASGDDRRYVSHFATCQQAKQWRRA
jgi:hypothetical protein